MLGILRWAKVVVSLSAQTVACMLGSTKCGALVTGRVHPRVDFFDFLDFLDGNQMHGERRRASRECFSGSCTSIVPGTATSGPGRSSQSGSTPDSFSPYPRPLLHSWACGPP